MPVGLPRQRANGAAAHLDGRAVVVHVAPVRRAASSIIGALLEVGVGSPREGSHGREARPRAVDRRHGGRQEGRVMMFV